MTTVISMLRGINLGKRRVKMEALRSVYESLGLQNPQTFIQSGNVVFRSSERSMDRLALRIEAAVENAFGFHADVLCRSATEMRDLIARNPFATREGIHPGKLLVVFLSAKLSAGERDKLLAIEAGPEELHALGSELFIYFPNGQARPKLQMNLVEKAHNKRWTGRNWNTVTKLLEIADQL